MTKPMSIYLDLVRSVAALMVFHNHAAYSRFGGHWMRPWGTFGNDGVMIFFVMSGFVIAYVAQREGANFRDFAVARTSRLWSVVLPALLITIVLDQAGSRIDPALYDGWWYASDQPIWRFTANLFFINNLWFDSVRAFSNGPFWSIGYEFWYYVVFAMGFFGPPRLRWLGVLLVIGFVGPRLALLLPIWMLGVAVFWLCQRRSIPEWLGWTLTLCSIVAYGLFRYHNVSDQLLHYTYGIWGKKAVRAFCGGYTERFMADYLMGAIVAAHFLGIYGIQHRIAGALDKVERPARTLGGYTFAIYLFHYPMLMFFGAIFGKQPLLLIALTSVGIVICAEFSEKKKGAYRAAVDAAVKRIEQAFRGPSAHRR